VQAWKAQLLPRLRAHLAGDVPGLVTYFILYQEAVLANLLEVCGCGWLGGRVGARGAMAVAGRGSGGGRCAACPSMGWPGQVACERVPGGRCVCKVAPWAGGGVQLGGSSTEVHRPGGGGCCSFAKEAGLYVMPSTKDTVWTCEWKRV
jgi:hypothetical protein